MSNFSQEDFNRCHQEAHEYGESEYLVVADNLTEAEATKKFKERIDEFYGDEPGRYNHYDLAGISKIGVGVGTNEDGEPDYVIFAKSGTPYQAWCVEQS